MSDLYVKLVTAVSFLKYFSEWTVLEDYKSLKLHT